MTGQPVTNAERLPLRQAVFVEPALVTLAHRAGLFAAHGVDVQTEYVTSSDHQHALLREGRCDLAVTAIDNLFVWNASPAGGAMPAPIPLIAQLETTTVLQLVLRPGLERLADLPVTRLGVDAPDNGFAVVLRAMVASLGLAPERYTLVESGGVRHRTDALLRGDVDATLLSHPLDALAVASGASRALAVGDIVNDYPGLGVVQAADADPRPVERYLRALEAARLRAHGADPASIAEMLGGDPDAARALLDTLPATLWPAPAGLQVLHRLRANLRMTVDGAPPPSGLLDATPLTRAGA